MNIIFSGVFYYPGPVRHLYYQFRIYKKLAKIFENVGIKCYYFSKQTEILPQDKTLTEKQFYEMLPDCDLLFMWNGGLGKEKEIAEKCRQQGTPIYFMELGWLPQQGSFYFDRKGVNYESSIRDWRFKPIDDEDKLFVKSRLADYHQRIAKFTGIKQQDFVFVPLQVSNDSQIVNFSPRIKTMQQLIDYVVAHVQDKIIFKKHPKEDLGDLKVPKCCQYYTTGTTHDFLTQCKYVVTINSTVGVEALTYNLPVITLGQAFYGGRGLTYEVENDYDMERAVAWALKGDVALGRIQSFLCYLFKRQWWWNDLDNPEKVMTLIGGLTE